MLWQIRSFLFLIKCTGLSLFFFLVLLQRSIRGGRWNFSFVSTLLSLDFTLLQDAIKRLINLIYISFLVLRREGHTTKRLVPVWDLVQRNSSLQSRLWTFDSGNLSISKTKFIFLSQSWSLKKVIYFIHYIDRVPSVIYSQEY